MPTVSRFCLRRPLMAGHLESLWSWRVTLKAFARRLRTTTTSRTLNFRSVTKLQCRNAVGRKFRAWCCSVEGAQIQRCGEKTWYVSCGCRTTVVLCGVSGLGKPQLRVLTTVLQVVFRQKPARNASVAEHATRLVFALRDSKVRGHCLVLCCCRLEHCNS